MKAAQPAGVSLRSLPPCRPRILVLALLIGLVGPSQAATAPELNVWTETEVAAAQLVCTRELATIAVEAERLAPLKQGVCGTPAPISVRSIGAAKVELKPVVVTSCPMAVALHKWVEMFVQPAARDMLGAPVIRLVTASSFVCRNRNNEVVGPISEHAYANAVDIAGFVLKDGRTITVLDGWGTPERETKAFHKPAATEAASATAAADPAGVTKDAQFLRRLHKGACEVFGTVLGPESDAYHRNHFHLDFKPRKTRSFCQ